MREELFNIVNQIFVWS